MSEVDLAALGLVALGVGLGVLVGAVPGLTATLAIALLLPFTFTLSPVDALLMLTGIYVGGIYGGSITAITLRIPGAPANTMTILDGNAMAKAGRVEEALGLATFSSFVGGLFGGVVLITLAPQLAAVALRFQSPETFSLILLALVAVAAVSGGSLVKGLAATTLGLALSTVGLDRMLPVPRYSFGRAELLVGVPLLPVVIGLFALTELFWQLSESRRRAIEGGGGEEPDSGPALHWRKSLDFLRPLREVGVRLVAKSAAIGAFVGVLPGGGAAMAAFLAYTEAKRSSKTPEAFGTGIPQGIVAPETANNAMTGGAFVPMLAFGIPGDAVTAVILGGLIVQGVTPGPLLLRETGVILTPLAIGYFFAYGVVLLIGLSLLPLFARLSRVDHAYLFPFVGGISLVAAFASERTTFAMLLATAVGLLGYVLRKGGFPVVPVLLGVLLGPPLESNFRRSLVVSESGVWVFVESPLSLALLVIALLVGLYFSRGPGEPSERPSP
jgi:putative tricarboxylic transport membrane protein